MEIRELGEEGEDGLRDGGGVESERAGQESG
jgi:hypothetical protein